MRIVLVTRGLLLVRMIVPPIVRVVRVNMHLLLEPLQRILPVPIVRDVQAVHMLMVAVQVRRILVVVTILHVPVRNTSRHLAQL